MCFSVRRTHGNWRRPQLVMSTHWERCAPRGETTMQRSALAIAAAVGLMMATTGGCFAQGSAKDYAPGQRMQEKGSQPGQPGASGYAPGQRMQDKGSKKGQPGASGYAPGRQDQTTGQGSRSGTGKSGNR